MAERHTTEESAPKRPDFIYFISNLWRLGAFLCFTAREQIEM